MSRLYEVATTVTAHLEWEHRNDPLSLIRAKGDLASKTGFLVSLIGPGDPDDADKLERLSRAAAEMGIPA